MKNYQSSRKGLKEVPNITKKYQILKKELNI